MTSYDDETLETVRAIALNIEKRIRNALDRNAELENPKDLLENSNISPDLKENLRDTWTNLTTQTVRKLSYLKEDTARDLRPITLHFSDLLEAENSIKDTFSNNAHKREYELKATSEERPTPEGRKTNYVLTKEAQTLTEPTKTVYYVIAGLLLINDTVNDMSFN